jgi:tRNA pseudouridine55 synthase
VTVSRFAVDLVEPGSADGGPVLGITVECSSGTYVRVLAADLGAALGGGAHLRRLRRTAVGPWTLDMAVPLEALTGEAVMPPAASLPWLSMVVAEGRLADDVAHGRVLDRDALGVEGDGPWRVVGAGGDLLAVYVEHGGAAVAAGTRVKPAVVLPPL